jgi:putative membrane protein
MEPVEINTELGSVAKSIGLTVPADLSADQQREYTNLSKLSGKTFDKQYIELMVNDHTKIWRLSRKPNQMFRIQS